MIRISPPSGRHSASDDRPQCGRIRTLEQRIEQRIQENNDKKDPREGRGGLVELPTRGEVDAT